MRLSRRLERLIERGDVPGLCRLLRQRNVLVRRRAAQALGKLGQPAAVPCLMHALREDTDQYVVRWSVEALARIGDQAALDVLFAASFGTDRDVAGLAAHALHTVTAPQAAELLELRDILLRSDWDALAAVGETGQRGLRLVLQSPQYAAWPSGKRKRVLHVATELGVSAPGRLAGDLADMGLFVSNVHTLGDVLGALRHRNPAVRIAAAEKLGASGQTWTTFALYRRFQREMRPDGDRAVAVALARALSQLGDGRAIALYKQRLYGVDGRQAADAARALSEVGTPGAIEALFWFVLEPPPTPRYRNVAVAMSALESAGPLIVDHLRPQLEHAEARVRRLMIALAARSGHPETATLLGRLARDADPDVQRDALDALGSLNNAEAVQELRAVIGEAPHEWVVRGLAAITRPEALTALREAAPDATMISGVLLEDSGQPVEAAHVQIVREHYFGERAGWGWQAVSARACTDAAGAFALGLLADVANVRLKVAMPSHSNGTDSETFMADLPLSRGEANHVLARIDRFLSRLVVAVELERSSER